MPGPHPAERKLLPQHVDTTPSTVGSTKSASRIVVHGKAFTFELRTPIKTIDRDQRPTPIEATERSPMPVRKLDFLSISETKKTFIVTQYGETIVDNRASTATIERVSSTMGVRSANNSETRETYATVRYLSTERYDTPIKVDLDTKRRMDGDVNTLVSGHSRINTKAVMTSQRSKPSQQIRPTTVNSVSHRHRERPIVYTAYGVNPTNRMSFRPSLKSEASALKMSGYGRPTYIHGVPSETIEQRFLKYSQAQQEAQLYSEGIRGTATSDFEFQHKLKGGHVLPKLASTAVTKAAFDIND